MSVGPATQLKIGVWAGSGPFYEWRVEKLSGPILREPSAEFLIPRVDGHLRL